MAVEQAARQAGDGVGLADFLVLLRRAAAYVNMQALAEDLVVLTASANAGFKEYTAVLRGGVRINLLAEPGREPDVYVDGVNGCECGGC